MTHQPLTSALSSGLTALTLADNGSYLASNYQLPTLNLANAAATINTASLTVTGNSRIVTYNGGAQTNTFSTSGLVGSDTVTSVTGYDKFKRAEANDWDGMAINDSSNASERSAPKHPTSPVLAISTPSIGSAPAMRAKLNFGDFTAT